MFRRPFAGLALWVCGLAACGPVQYISQVTSQASSELAAAKAAGGDKHAPYEYTSAVVYLHKAREEAGYADFQAAVRLGKIAQKMAEKAKEMALASAGQPPDEAPASAAAKDSDESDKEQDSREKARP